MNEEGIIAQLLPSAPGKNEDASRALRLLWLPPINKARSDHFLIEKEQHLINTQVSLMLGWRIDLRLPNGIGERLT